MIETLRRLWEAYEVKSNKAIQVCVYVYVYTDETYTQKYK